jgi:hypothetical protein
MCLVVTTHRGIKVSDGGPLWVSHSGRHISREKSQRTAATAERKLNVPGTGIDSLLEIFVVCRQSMPVIQPLT